MLDADMSVSFYPFLTFFGTLLDLIIYISNIFSFWGSMQKFEKTPS